jgi:hypothetical protein
MGCLMRPILTAISGGECSEPWFNCDSTLQNGFYWLTILDEVPRPHNNIWIHHHRKVVIDSDNNKESWSKSGMEQVSKTMAAIPSWCLVSIKTA